MPRLSRPICSRVSPYALHWPPYALHWPPYALPWLCAETTRHRINQPPANSKKRSQF